MEIRKVTTIEEARICDSLLTNLIKDEAKYNNLINPNFEVTNYFENIYQNNDNLLLVAEDKEIAGYIYVKRIELDNNIPTALIDGLFVKEEYRNKGIASKLIEASLSWCKENNIKAVKIRVITSNKNALNLYQKYNFMELSKELINYIN